MSFNFPEFFVCCFFLKKDFIYFQSEREGERGGEKHQCVVSSHMPPYQGPGRNPGMCTD